MFSERMKEEESVQYMVIKTGSVLTTKETLIQKRTIRHEKKEEKSNVTYKFPVILFYGQKHRFSFFFWYF